MVTPPVILESLAQEEDDVLFPSVIYLRVYYIRNKGENTH